MATSADLARILPDGTVQYTHVSGDGYPSGAGAILYRGYQTSEALDALFAGDQIEELLPDEVNHYEDERDPSWPWDYMTVSYLYQDGKWFYRDWDEDDDNPPLIPLTREAILKDADSFGGQDGVLRVGGFLDGLSDTL